MTWINFMDLQEKVPIVDLMARYGVALKRYGKGYRSACPIHKNGKPGQFSVSPDKNMFCCFADCGVSGGVLRFVMMMERCNAREAALLLSQWFNVFSPKPQKYVGREFLRRLESVAESRRVPTLIFARRLLEEGLQREEVLMSKSYEESTKYLEGILTLIIGGENDEHQCGAPSRVSDEGPGNHLHPEQHAGVQLHGRNESPYNAQRRESH
jgi:CHC2-type zinc finger protein